LFACQNWTTLKTDGYYVVQKLEYGNFWNRNILNA